MNLQTVYDYFNPPVTVADYLAPEPPEDYIEVITAGSDVAVLTNLDIARGFVIATDVDAQEALVWWRDSDASNWKLNWWGVARLTLWTSFNIENVA